MNKAISIDRSPVYRKTHTDATAVTQVNGFTVPLNVGKESAEIASLRTLALCDFSWLPRVGFKGRNTVSALAKQGLSIPEQPNALATVGDGRLVIRLGVNEFLVLADLNSLEGSSAETFCDLGMNNIEFIDPDVYYLPRQDSHACFVIAGDFVPKLMAKICAVDLSVDQFPNYSVAQTAVARLSAIIVRNDLAGTPCYLILIDSASAEYLWDCVACAMQEFDGGVVGLKAIRAALSA